MGLLSFTASMKIRDDRVQIMIKDMIKKHEDRVFWTTMFHTAKETDVTTL